MFSHNHDTQSNIRTFLSDHSIHILHIIGDDLFGLRNSIKSPRFPFVPVDY